MPVHPEKPQPPQTEKQASTDMDNEDSNMMMNEEAASGGGNEQQQGAQQQKQVKKKTKTIDLPLTSKVPQLTKNEINILIEQEVHRIISLPLISGDVEN